MFSRFSPPPWLLKGVYGLMVVSLVLSSVAPVSAAQPSSAPSSDAVQGRLASTHVVRSASVAGPSQRHLATLSREGDAPDASGDGLLTLSISGPEEMDQGEKIVLEVRAWHVGRKPLRRVRIDLYEEGQGSTRVDEVILPELAPDAVAVRQVEVAPSGVGRIRLRAIAQEGVDDAAAAEFSAVVRQTRPDVWRPAPGDHSWRPQQGPLEIVLPAHGDGSLAQLAHRALFGRDQRAGSRFLLAQFELTAQDAQGQPVVTFETPVRLRWHYKEAMAEAPPILPPRFVWWDAAQGRWEVLPTVVDEEAGVIETEVTHFSTYGIDEPVAEKVEDPFSGLEASLFTGSLHYRYSIPLFQRPGGFGPGLALSYESRRRDANQGTGSYDFLVGWGWRLDGLGYINYVDSSPTYKLVLGGASYTIKKDANWNWYAEEAPWIKITRANSNQDADWHVHTPDGTHYIFKEKLTYWHCSKHQEEAKRFMLTSITAPADDGTWAYSMNVHYGTETREADTGCGMHNYVYQVWPTSITYNGVSGGHALSVSFGYATGRDDRPSQCETVACDTANSKKAFLYFYTRNLTDITLKVDGRVARRYHLQAHVTNSGVSFHGHRLLLDGIQVYGKDNAGPRPATTFTYRNPEDCHFQENCRIETIDSGQGGKAEITYQGQGGASQVTYYVSTRTLTDLVTNQSIQEQYTFSGWDDAAGGYDFSQVKNLADGERHSHWFYHEGRGDDKGENGQERMVVHQKGDGTWMDKLWQSYRLPEGLTDAKQRHLLDTQIYSLYQEQNGTNTEYPVWKKVHRYKQNHQGGGQYGNLTHLYEYQRKGNGWDLVRTTERTYHPNNASAHYIVNRVAEEKVWAGNVGGACLSHVRYYYDHQGLATPPQAGLLTKQEAAEQTCGSGFVTQVENSYDNWDNIIAVADGLGRTTTTAYDNDFHAFVVRVTNALNQTTTADYGSDGVDRALGWIHGITDANGQTTTYTYDAFGRLRQVNRPLGASVDEAWVYGDYGDSNHPRYVKHRVRDDVTANGDDGYLTTWTFYDGLGRELQQQSERDGGGRILASVHYDAHGRRDKEGIPYADNGSLGTFKKETWTGTPPYYTSYAYDALGRVTTVTHPDGTQVRTFYSVGQTGSGERRLVTTMVDENNHQTVQRKDAFGRLRRVDRYEGEYPNATRYASARYDYDALDRLTDVYGPGESTALDTSNHTHIGYDALGRKTSMSDPDMGAWSYEYDAVGNLIRQTDARNRTICFYYDDLNRLAGKKLDVSGACPSLPNPSDSSFYSQVDVWYKYDQQWDFGLGYGTNYGVGRRTTMKNGGSKVQWVYDQRGRVLAELRKMDPQGGGQWGESFTTRWTYDAMDRVKTMKYPDGEVVTYTYNSQGLVERVSGSSVYVQSTDYDASGRVRLRKLGNDVVEQEWVYYAWDMPNGRGRLQRIKAGTPSNTTSLQDLRYTYDAVGNVLSIQDWKAGAPGSPQTQSFSYDPLNRLKTAQADPGGGSYGPESYAYDPMGNLKSKTGVGSYTYGASASDCQAGTPAVKPHAVTTAGGYSFSYDCNGNVLQRNVGSVYHLTYDAENRLTSVSGAATASFVYDADGNRVKAVLGGVTTYYVGNYYEKTGNTIKKYYDANGQRVAMREGSALYWLLSDHLGSTAITAYSGGSKKAELRYKAWGETRYTYGTTPTSYRFTGQREDAAIGLYFYHARYYDPTLARFIQPDTIVPDPGDPQSLNRYSYAANNPVRYTDPSGHCPEGEAGQACREELERIQREYGITINDDNGLWTIEALHSVAAGMKALRNAMKNQHLFSWIVSGITFVVWEDYNGMAYREGTIGVGEEVLPNENYLMTYTIHELAHVWDEKTKEQKSSGLVKVTGGTPPSTNPFIVFLRDKLGMPIGKYKVGGNPPTSYATKHPYEDWAESLMVTIFPNKDKLGMGKTRREYVIQQLGWFDVNY